MARSSAKEDLFQDSTMTFGQHLEELRICLFKAIVGLVIGCGIGLLVGGRVVRFITTPVETALTDYYQKQATAKSFDAAEIQKLESAGYTDPTDLERIRKIVTKQRVAFDVVYIDPKKWLGQLGIGSAEVASTLKTDVSAPETTDQGLKALLIFHPIADDPRTHMSSMNAQETFMIYMEASLVVGAVIASPWIFYQIWSFVAAGLYPNERRYVQLFLPFSIGLFLLGAGLAYFLVFKQVLSFLLSFNSMEGVDPILRINEWLGFVLMLPLGFGVSFQLPLVMLFMERIGILTVQAYISSWRIAVLTIFVLAMILTPSPDPYSMMLMAGPLSALYFGGILLCRYLPRRRGALRGA